MKGPAMDLCCDCPQLSGCPSALADLAALADLDAPPPQAVPAAEPLGDTRPPRPPVNR